MRDANTISYDEEKRVIKEIGPLWKKLNMEKYDREEREKFIYKKLGLAENENVINFA